MTDLEIRTACLPNHKSRLDTVGTTCGSGWVHAQPLSERVYDVPTRYRRWY